MDWIEKNDPVAAAELEQAVYERRLEAGDVSKSQWQEFIEKYAETGSVKVLPYKIPSLGLVEFATPEALFEIKLGAQFYFQISIPGEGFLWGFEGYEGLWYPMALQRGAANFPVPKGTANFPSQDEGNNIDPVCENRDLGRHEFVFVFLAKTGSHDAFSDLQVGKRQSAENLNRIADYLAGTPEKDWRLFQCSIMVRA